MRFCMVTTFYPPYHFGGDATFVRMFAHTLNDLGHTVDIIHNVDAYRILNKGTDPEPTIEPAGITVHRLESRMPMLSCLVTQQLGYPLFHARRIQKILDQGKYDVIHFHNISLVGGPSILAFGDAIKIYTAHEHWLVCPTHVLWRHNKEICTERQCLRCIYAYRRPPQIWRMTGLMARKAKHIDVFCSPSHFSANKHKEFGFEERMEVLPLFLPDTQTNKRWGPSSSSASKKYFLFVGRLEIIKGLQDVIPVFDNNSPAELWIVGTGIYESELRKLAKMKNTVKFLGWKTQEELLSIYREALAVITPSSCYEVFPLVVIEAFREGKPIIARGLGPYPEIIQQSKAGMIFNTQDDLKEAIAVLERNDKLRNEMGAAARQAYENHWCPEAALPRYFELIKQAALKNHAVEVVRAVDALLGNKLRVGRDS